MAQGYVTEDGTFFESKLEAELHEAESLLRANLVASFPQVEGTLDQFFAIVFEVMPTLKGYIDAYNAANTAKLNQQAEDEDRGKATDGQASPTDASTGHVSSTEKDLEALLKLPTRRPSNVSDVGGRSRTKKVSDRRKVDGA